MPSPADVWNITEVVVKLADDLQNYHAELRDLRQELRDLTLVVQRLQLKMGHFEERAGSEHKLLLLELENSLLKFERRLPPTARPQNET